jgi:hypothetical protein
VLGEGAKDTELAYVRAAGNAWGPEHETIDVRALLGSEDRQRGAESEPDEDDRANPGQGTELVYRGVYAR